MSAMNVKDTSMTSQQPSMVAPTTVRIKRKRNQAPLDALYLDEEEATMNASTDATSDAPRKKRKIFTLSKTQPLAQTAVPTSVTPVTTAASATVRVGPTPISIPRNEPVKLRVAKRTTEGELELVREEARKRGIAGKMDRMNMDTNEDDWVYDVYTTSTSPNNGAEDVEALDGNVNIGIVYWNPNAGPGENELVFETEKSDEEAYDSADADSNDEDAFGNEYPDEEEVGWDEEYGGGARGEGSDDEEKAGSEYDGFSDEGEAWNRQQGYGQGYEGAAEDYY